MNALVLLRDGTFWVILGTNVSRFATAVEDNILSGYLWKNRLRSFHFFQGNCGLGFAFVAHSVLCQTCGYSRHILP